MKDTNRVIAALLIGAAAGAALGLLLAPEKGTTVRDGIADFINELVDSANAKTQSAANNLKTSGGKVYDRARSKIRGAVSEVSEYRDDVISAAKAKIKDITDEAVETLNGVKANVKGTADDLNNSVQKL